MNREITIRIMAVEEIERLYPIADSFFKASEFSSDFNPEHFKARWTAFISNGYGVIFVIEKNEEVVGCLGALKYSDPNNGKIMATEMFWFVLPEHRGKGTLLLDAFEIWAHREGCQSLIMVYLTDSMPEKVKNIYENRGFRPMEVHYVKEV